MLSPLQEALSDGDLILNGCMLTCRKYWIKETLQYPSSALLVIINNISLMYPVLGYFGSKYSSLYECLIYACEDLDCLTGYLVNLDEWVAL